MPDATRCGAPILVSETFARAQHIRGPPLFYCHCRVPTRFLHAASANARISPPKTSRRTVMAVAFFGLIETPHNISPFKSP